jgi:hypothetical protein
LSPFNYQPAGHVNTGDVNIVRNEKLKLLVLKGPKFRDPWSFKWQQNFISIMNAFEDYARRWAKSEKEELDSLSEWVKSMSHFKIPYQACSIKNAYHLSFCV